MRNKHDHEISTDAQVHYQAGLNFISKQDHKKAIQEFDEALKLSPNYHPALTQRGVCYFVLGQYQKAIFDLDRANQFDPKNYGIFYYRSAAYFNLNQLQKALENINEALKLLPNYVTYLASLDKIQKTIAAQKHFQNACDYFEQKKDYSSALQQINEAIRLDPSYGKAYCVRGSCYREMGKLKEAVAEYDKAVQFEPNYIWSYYNLALTCKLFGDHQQTLNNINLFLKMHPDNGSAIALRNETQRKLQAFRADFLLTLCGLVQPLPTQSVAIPNTQKYFLDMQTKWYTAATNGDLKTLQQMVNTYLGTIHLTNPWDRTALHAAASTGQIAVLEFLLTQGADLKAICETDGCNAMDYAIYNNRPEAVRLLYNKGAASLKVGSGDYFQFSVLPTITNENKVYVIDAGFEFPVDYTVFGRLGDLNFSTLNTVPQCQAALQAINVYLMYLYNYIHYSPDPTTVSARTEQCKFANAFWQAKKSEIQKMIDILSVKGGAQHYVAHKGFIQILEYFIQIGASLVYVDTLGNTPLHVAAASGHLNCVKAMIEKADPAKHYCEATGRILTLKEFINKPNQEGLTALHMTAINGRVEVMQYLMRQGADLSAKSKAGLNALDYAKYHNKNDAFNWLKNIKEISFGNERIYIANHYENNNEWVITSSHSQKHFSFCVREEKQIITAKKNQQDVEVLVTEHAINETMKQFDYVNPAERKSVAIAALGATSLFHFQESLANPQKQILNYSIKDEPTLAAVQDKVEKSDVKIVYSHGMIAGKTSTTEWGLAMMECHREQLSQNKTSNSPTLVIAEKVWDSIRHATEPLAVKGEGIKGLKVVSILTDLAKRIVHSTPNETYTNQLICVPLGVGTQFIGSSLVTYFAAKSILAATIAIPTTDGLSILAIPIVRSAWAEGLEVVKTASNAVQNSCEDFYKEPIKEEKPINEPYLLGNTVKFTSQPFFTLSSGIQSMPIFNKYVSTSSLQTTFALKVELPAPTSQSLKSTQSMLTSTSNITSKLQQGVHNMALAKEKQQTALYLQKNLPTNQLVIKQLLSQRPQPMANHSPSLNSYASIYSPNKSSNVISSGGPVTDTHGNAVTTGGSVNYSNGAVGPESWGREGWDHGGGRRR